jgi:hypothetical protein
MDIGNVNQLEEVDINGMTLSDSPDRLYQIPDSADGIR